MSETAKSRNGQDLPMLSLATAVYQTIDGTGGHAESSVLEPGKYRIVISESAGNNAFINISEVGTAAETGKGAYMPLGLVEYIYIDANSIISVVDGILNIVKAY